MKGGRPDVIPMIAYENGPAAMEGHRWMFMSATEPGGAGGRDPAGS